MIRNLIFHITPTTTYRWNLDLLKRNWNLFNGKKVLAISVGESGSKKFKFDPEAHVYIHKLFPDAQKLFIPNDKELKEQKTFLPLLRAVASKSKEEVTFYGHVKGVTRPWNQPIGRAVKLWVESLHYYNLERYFDLVEPLLQRHSCVGAYKRYGKFLVFPKGVRWHYSGTFWWFRHDKLFAHKNWEAPPKTRYEVESYLATLFTRAEAGCQFQDGGKSMFNERYAIRMLRAQRDFWKYHETH